jgi:hypothetical protein
LALLSFIILGTWADAALAEDYPPLKGYFPFAHNFAPFDDWSATKSQSCAVKHAAHATTLTWAVVCREPRDARLGDVETT